MTKHLLENEIDLLVASPHNLAESDRRRYLAHVKGCALCREHFEIAQRFFGDLTERLRNEESAGDSLLADRVLAAKSVPQLPFRGLAQRDALPDDLIEFSEIKPNNAVRMVKLAVRYPVRATAGVGLIAAAVGLMMNLATISAEKDPAYAKIEHAVLTVYDKDGEALWQKNALGMPEGSTLTGFFFPTISSPVEKVIVIDDVHPRRGLEVLIRGFPLPSGIQVSRSPSSFSAESLYCYDARGKLIWSQSYPVEEFASFYREKGGKWNIAGMFAIPTSNKTQARLFVYVYNEPFSPSALLEVDGATGKRLQGYVHFGNIIRAIAWHVAGERQTTIIANGVNNSYNLGFLAAFDPDKLSGLGPIPPKFGFGGSDTISPAVEMSYLLFPRSHLSEVLSTTLYNGPRTISVSSDGNLIVTVDEFPHDPDKLKGSILYSFDTDLRVQSLTFSDELQRTYKLLTQAGRRFEPLDNQYAEKLKKQIQYWDGEKFVSTPTRNRRYVKAANPP